MAKNDVEFLAFVSRNAQFAAKFDINSITIGGLSGGNKTFIKLGSGLVTKVKLVINLQILWMLDQG